MSKEETKKQIDFRYNLSEYWNLLKKHKGKLLIVIFATIIMDSLALADKFLLKRIIDDGSLFSSGSLATDIFVKTLLIIALIYLTLVIFKSTMRWVYVHFINGLDSTLVRDLKVKYFNKIIRLSHKFHTTHKTGSLFSKLGRGANAVETLTDVIVFNFAPLTISLALAVSVLAYFNKTSAFIVFGVAVVFVVYSWVLQSIQQRYRVDLNREEDTEKAFVGDVFTNIDSIKYFGKENSINQKFRKLTKNTRDSFIKYEGFFRWFDSGQLMIVGLGLALLLYFPLRGFLAGEITLGTLTLIYTTYGSVTSPLFSFVWGLRNFYRAMADCQDLFEYNKTENDVKDKTGAKKAEITKGEIEFDNITFSYGKKKAFGLQNFSLKIRPNEKIALVGHSGCGKTTLIKLLYRFYDVKEGKILIDKKDIKDLQQESLRSELSIVPQECVLFDDTIYNNIRFSNPDAKRKEVLQAIKFAQLDKIIAKFPLKENTVVGERGVKLSGGEKQRVSIARALLANKKILVLDEATSALDSETEYEIQKSLDELLKGRTSIIIAHRLSTIMKADRIIVMQGGKIIQEGNHEKLIKQPGEYQKLWNLQKGGYIK